MARKYVLDTNLYIDAIRDPVKEQALEQFLERNAPMTYMSAVVMQELRAGAVTDAQARALQDGIFDTFERRNRIAGPSVAAFKDCGRILALVNDILLAITCRENGFTLLTADNDFRTIRPHVRGFAYAPPWPTEVGRRRTGGAGKLKPT